MLLYTHSFLLPAQNRWRRYTHIFSKLWLMKIFLVLFQEDWRVPQQCYCSKEGDAICTVLLLPTIFFHGIPKHISQLLLLWADLRGGAAPTQWLQALLLPLLLPFYDFNGMWCKLQAFQAGKSVLIEKRNMLLPWLSPFFSSKVATEH